MGSFERKLRRKQQAQVPASDITGRIARLRSLMVDSVDLSEISGFFDAILANDVAFMRASEPGQNERLISVARIALKVVVSEHAPIEQLLLSVPKFHLWHGMLLFQSGVMARIIYFGDINRGLCTAGRLDNAMCHHMRFSVPEEMTEPIDPEHAQLAGVALRGQASDPN